VDPDQSQQRSPTFSNYSDPQSKQAILSGQPQLENPEPQPASDQALLTQRTGHTLGRKTRAVPPSLRRALRARDGCCRFPGCTNSRGLHAHHLEHWADGGQTELANLILLCRRHHRLVHEDGWTADQAGLFRDPFGLPVPAVPATPQGRLDELRRLNEQLDLGPQTGKHGRGEQIDLGYVSDALVRIIKRRRSKPRPRLVWTFTEYGPKHDRYGPARIDTPDQDGTIIATQHLADRINLFHANMLALERGLEVDIRSAPYPLSLDEGCS
jgi:hypothetical protein